MFNNRFNIKMKTIKKIVVTFILLFVATLIASFIFGIMLTISNNIQSVGLNQFSFDPMITIAYMILFYFATLFFQPDTNAQFYLFLFTLFRLKIKGFMLS